MNKHSYRVPYADTDKMGVVYYANYLTYFEIGRTELLRQLGITYKDLEEKQIYFPVINANCNYHASARYDDLLTIETSICEVKNASMTFSYKIFCKYKLLVTGTTKHPMVNATFKPARMPADLKELLTKNIDADAAAK